MSGGTLTGNLNLGDNNVITLGTGSDFKIYHDGSNSVIKDEQGHQLYLQSTGFNLSNSSGLKHIYANNAYGVTLYYQDNAKLETQSGGVAITGSLTVGGTLAWNAGNDGSGSGLDADTVDGIQASNFLRSDGNDTTTGRLSVNDGIQLTYGAGGIRFGGTANVHMRALSANANSKIDFSSGSISVGTNTVFHQGNDGSGSGLDADTCDGQHLGSTAAVRFGSVEYYNGTSSNIKVQVAGTGDTSSKMYWKKAGTTNLLTLDMSGNLTATGNVTAYSDRRIKENITPITGALSKVQRLTGNTYTRNDQEDTATKYAGLIAQEVEDVLPEAVREVDDGIKALDYNATIALLVESIKELKTEVDDLKSQLENK